MHVGVLWVSLTFMLFVGDVLKLEQAVATELAQVGGNSDAARRQVEEGQRRQAEEQRRPAEEEETLRALYGCNASGTVGLPESNAQPTRRVVHQNCRNEALAKAR